MRTVICHYHIYKNSGVSFDTLLRSNYSDKHISFDGPFPFFVINQDQLAQIVNAHPEAISFSSHQTRLPVPVSMDFRILPVIFVRHPLIRIHSVYQFKRKIQDGSTLSNWANEWEFDRWARECLSDESELRQVSNMQTGLLSSVHMKQPESVKIDRVVEFNLHQAINNINSVELLARTEYFDDDVSRFPAICEQHGIEFKFEQIDPQNSTSEDIQSPLPERIRNIKQKLSKNIYNQLIEANKQDQHLFDHVSDLIQARHG